ncbi:MAG: hypothetical protein R2705_16700 [Ilumatobacteraceae bacterium]
MLLGCFADTGVSAGGADGLFFRGGVALLGDQLLATVITFAFSFLVSGAIGLALHRTIGLRVSPDQERAGLDQSQHAETAYQP